jgi:hypothetical protein
MHNRNIAEKSRKKGRKLAKSPGKKFSTYMFFCIGMLICYVGQFLMFILDSE